MIKYIIFGCGESGKQAACELGEHKIAYFIDNHKTGKIGEIDVYNLRDGIQKKEENMLILIPSKQFRKEMIQQLEELGVEDYLYYELGSMLCSSASKKLDKDEWGKLYSSFHVDKIASQLEKKQYTVWTEEILKLTKKNDKILEIGCGTGQSSVTLALEERNVTAMDYSEESIATTELLSEKMGTNIRTVCGDATKELPFEEKEFDLIFQAGLLEHFTKEEQIDMLMKWKHVGKRMVSMIPNANSVLYRAGKERMERSGEWPFGLEMPQASLYDTFLQSGIKNVKEYTIGMQNALDFLPKDHYLRVTIEKLMEDEYDVDAWGQGYLLVTYGEC